MLQKDCGILVAPCGTGKTVMSMAMIHRLGMKTLFICHTRDLLEQARNTARKYFNDKVLLGDLDRIGDITFATVQSLVKWDVTKSDWGCVIVDEAHRVAGSYSNWSMYNTVLSSLNAKYKYGLTATPFRSDGLFRCTTSLLGDVSYKVEQNNKVAVSYRKINTGIKIDLQKATNVLNTTLNYSKYISLLANNEDRNSFIAHILMQFKHRNMLCLGSVKSVLNSLCTMCRLGGMNCVVLSSDLVQSKRNSILAYARKYDNYIIFATNSIAKEGIDIPKLDTLCWVTPIKDKGTIIQSIGRGTRQYEGKKYLEVYDFVDEDPYSKKVWRERYNTIKKYTEVMQCHQLI
jgi:superfamily II DNA or RNA helicase